MAALLEFSYNLANLPESVEGADGASLTYSYLSDGSKWRASANEGPSILYRGSFVYEDDGNSSRISSIAWDEGRISYHYAPAIDSLAVVDSLVVEFGEGVVDSLEVVGVVDSLVVEGRICDEWHVRDHLGSVRAIAGIGNQVTGIRELNTYLPFGTRIPGSIQAADNRHRFGGKEEQRYGTFNIGLSDFGARYYDPYACRWTTRDPMAGKYPEFSPYMYCHNNPLCYIDPNGLADYFDCDGNFLFNDSIDDGRVLITSQSVIDEANNAMVEGVLGEESLDILNAGSMTFSSAFRSGVLNGELAALNIYERYLDQNVIVTIDNTIGVKNMAFNAEDGVAIVKVNNDLNLHGSHLFDNSYNIINAYAHETKHYLDWQREGEAIFKKESRAQYELSAIEYQMAHLSWMNTTKEFKSGIMEYKKEQEQKRK